MTACAMMHPLDGWPVLLSDTVVSSEAAPIHEIAPTRLRGRLRSDLRQGYLARKSYILNARCAIAVAGEESVIRSFLEDADTRVELSKLQHYEDGFKPMRALGALANEMGSGVHVVGAYVLPGRSGYNLLHPQRHQSEVLGRLGNVTTIGSGAADLSGSLKAIDETLPPEKVNPERYLAASRLVVQKRLKQEIFQRDWDPHWGGYLERLDCIDESWQRGPKTLHLHYQFSFEGGVLRGPELVARIIAYDPGGSFGQILAFIQEPDHNSFNLYGLRDLLLPRDQTLLIPDGYWEKWRPEVVCVTSVVISEDRPEIGDIFGMGTHPCDEGDSTLISADGVNFRFELNRPRVNRMLEQHRDWFVASIEQKCGARPTIKR